MLGVSFFTVKVIVIENEKYGSSKFIEGYSYRKLMESSNII